MEPDHDGRRFQLRLGNFLIYIFSGKIIK